MLFGPLQFLREVAQVTFKRNVVFPRLQLVIKMLVIDGVLLQHYAVPCQQIRQSVRSNCAVNIDLVFILQNTQYIINERSPSILRLDVHHLIHSQHLHLLPKPGATLPSIKT